MMAENFSTLFGLSEKIGRTTITELIINRDKYQNVRFDPNRKAIREPEQPILETCLMMWHSNVISPNLPISENMLIAQAKICGERIGISELEFHYSMVG